MKLAAVQYSPPEKNCERARCELRALILRAEGAQLIVCPEMAISGYVFSSRDDIESVVEVAKGPTFEMLRECAIELDASIVCGIAEQDGSAFFNSSLTISNDGSLLACYRKILLYSQDNLWAQPGHRRMVVPIPGIGSVCPAICMDLNDDGFVNYIHRAGPDVIAFCANWTDEGVDVLPYWRMRLFGWQGWIVVANRWGTEKGTHFYGGSALLGPDDLVLAVLPKSGDAVLLADTVTRAWQMV